MDAKGEEPNEVAVCPTDGEEPKPNAGVLKTPKPGELLTPNAVVPEVPNAGPGVDEPNALVAPNRDVDVEPNVGVVEAPKAGAVVAPKAGVVVAPKAGVVVTPKAGVVVAPKVLLPNAGLVCWNVLPNGLDWLGDDPKAPKLGFCPNKDPTDMQSRALC
jgi:hypothetical protein